MQKSLNVETWVIGGTLFTQDSLRTTLRANLHIIDGTIVEITSRFPAHPSLNTTLIDASGLTILPGFVQAHVHLCQSLFRNQADDLELLDWLSKRIWPLEAAHTKETLFTSALLGIYELLSSGTTCILDMGTVRHTSSILEAVQVSGIRANVGKCLMDHPTQTPSTLRESTESALKEADELYYHWNGKDNDRIRISYAPRFAISCTEGLLKQVAARAVKSSAIIHTHASENLKEIELIRANHHCENIEYLDRLGLTSSHLVLAHCVWLNASEKKILEETGTHVVHCPSSNMKLASGFAPILELKTRGINIALGADGTPCNNNLSMFNEIRMASLIHKPKYGPRTLPAMEVLDMATRNGARALNWFDQIGSIELGKKADLIALNLQTPVNTVPAQDLLNPEAIASSIVYSSQANHVDWTMVDGKLVYQRGKVLAIPEEFLMNEVHQAQKFLLKEVLERGHSHTSPNQLL